jgi:hypothetical protein
VLEWLAVFEPLFWNNHNNNFEGKCTALKVTINFPLTPTTVSSLQMISPKRDSQEYIN